MNLAIVAVIDRGVPNRERLHLVAQTLLNLSFYAVFSTIKFPNGKVAAFPRNSFWFSQYFLKPGDNVVLYTGPGQFSQQTRGDGGTDYFFHWGLKQTIWDDPNSCAVLLEISGWQTSP